MIHRRDVILGAAVSVAVPTVPAAAAAVSPTVEQSSPQAEDIARARDLLRSVEVWLQRADATADPAQIRGCLLDADCAAQALGLTVEFLRDSIYGRQISARYLHTRSASPGKAQE
jgi:hypothetical protein